MWTKDGDVNGGGRSSANENRYASGELCQTEGHQILSILGTLLVKHTGIYESELANNDKRTPKILYDARRRSFKITILYPRTFHAKTVFEHRAALNFEENTKTNAHLNQHQPETKPTNQQTKLPVPNTSAATDTTDTSTRPLTPMAVYRLPMARPGEAAAPFFDKSNVTEFIRYWEEECEEGGYTDVQKCTRLPAYCAEYIRIAVKSLTGYRTKDSEALIE